MGRTMPPCLGSVLPPASKQADLMQAMAQNQMIDIWNLGRPVQRHSKERSPVNEFDDLKLAGQ